MTVDEFLHDNPEVEVFEDVTHFGGVIRWRWSDDLGSSGLFDTRDAAIRDAAESLGVELDT